MSLVPHLVDTDVRRFKMALVAWVAIVGAAALFYGARPALPDAGRLDSLTSFLAIMVWIGGVLFMLGFIAQAVQSDSLVGTNAFWMTRPIPPLSLLAAKAVFLGAAMVVLPVVAEVLLMASHNVEAGTMMAVAAQAAAGQLFWLAIAMVDATLTVGVAQFFLLCGSTPLALAFVLLSFEYAIAPLLDHWTTLSAFEDTRAGTVFLVLAIVAVAGLLVTVYRTRSRQRTMALAVAMMLVIIGLPELVPKPRVINPAPEWATRLGALTADVRLERASPNEAALQGRVFTTGLRPNWSATIRIRNEVSPSSDIDRTVRLIMSDFSTPAVWEAGARDPSTIAALKTVLGIESIHAMAPNAFVATIRLSDSQVEHTVHYRETLRLSLVERSVAAVLPLERGAAFNDGARRASILDVESPDESGRMVIVVRESIAKTLLRPDDGITFEGYLRNTRTSEAINSINPFQAVGDNFSSSMLLPLPVVTNGYPFGFHVRRSRYTFPTYYASRSAGVRVDNSWRTSAELVIVRVRDAGYVDRELDVPALPVPAPFVVQ